MLAKKQAIDAASKNMSWMTLPFHAVLFHSGLAGCIRRFCSSTVAVGILIPIGMNIQTRLAWKNVGPPLALELKNCTTEKSHAGNENGSGHR